ncbi:DUF488 domain-containing protein [Actinomyces minihominis]|uniref:DUF488 domain-containing protein n=1 Tax=Actinomyces minihominis TaxID=2002838 RepID=UPI000C083A85|nr:DUF488 family protein [Actinomyces minihominis]
MGTTQVQVKRIYEDVEPSDGARVLVDRLWPRGISKERADLTLWAKEVAPSTDLRKWYNHDPAKFADFTAKYEDELKNPPQSDEFAKLVEMAKASPLTLLTASKAVDISEASVLQKLLMP